MNLAERLDAQLTIFNIEGIKSYSQVCFEKEWIVEEFTTKCTLCCGHGTIEVPDENEPWWTYDIECPRCYGFGETEHEIEKEVEYVDGCWDSNICI